MRTSQPHLTQKQKPRTKNTTKQKRIIDHQVRKALNPDLPPQPDPYEHRTEQRKQSNKDAIIRRLKVIRKGKTSKDRTLLKRITREDKRWRQKKAGKVKTCTHCLEEKAHCDFDLQMDSVHPKGMLRPYCRMCRSKKNAEAYQKRKTK